MRRAAVWALALCACAGAGRREEKMREPPSELDRNLQTLMNPSGDRPFQAYKRAALDWLVAHADEAHPRLLALCQGDDPPPVILDALPRFGRVESVPVLARALRHASDPTTVVAAQALGQHPRPEALAALEAALGDARDQVVASACEGLRVRGDRAACPALDRARAHPNAEVRGRVEEARAALGCR
jgi:HEAT repeat protein